MSTEGRSLSGPPITNIETLLRAYCRTPPFIFLNEEEVKPLVKELNANGIVSIEDLIALVVDKSNENEVHAVANLDGELVKVCAKDVCYAVMSHINDPDPIYVRPNKKEEIFRVRIPMLELIVCGNRDCAKKAQFACVACLKSSDRFKTAYCSKECQSVAWGRNMLVCKFAGDECIGAQEVEDRDNVCTPCTVGMPMLEVIACDNGKCGNKARFECFACLHSSRLSTVYCSKECQVADWGYHMPFCEFGHYDDECEGARHRIEDRDNVCRPTPPFVWWSRRARAAKWNAELGTEWESDSEDWDTTEAGDMLATTTTAAAKNPPQQQGSQSATNKTTREEYEIEQEGSSLITVSHNNGNKKSKAQEAK